MFGCIRLSLLLLQTTHRIMVLKHHWMHSFCIAAQQACWPFRTRSPHPPIHLHPFPRTSFYIKQGSVAAEQESQGDDAEVTPVDPLKTLKEEVTATAAEFRIQHVHMPLHEPTRPL